MTGKIFYCSELARSQVPPNPVRRHAAFMLILVLLEWAYELKSPGSVWTLSSMVSILLLMELALKHSVILIG